MAPHTSSTPNVAAQSRTQSGQTSGKKSKHRSNRKRSTSSPFASLFATLASFSSSSTSTAAVPAIRSPPAAPRASNSLPSTSAGLNERPVPVAQDDTVSKGMPPRKDASSKALVRRATTPSKQALVSTKPLTKSSGASKPPRPDVFSFQNGESRPPSPRPRGASSTSKALSKSVRKSVDTERVYSSPIPVRPVTVPSAGTSNEDSYSDSGLTASETPSPPDTPSPLERRPLAPFPPSPGSQDAVGRSIHSEDIYKGRRRQQLQRVDVPPKAPTAPHVQQQQSSSQSSHTLRTSSFDYLSPPSFQNAYNIGLSNQPYPMSPIFSTPLGPGQIPGNGPPNPYPTPPLDHGSPLGGRQTRKPGYSLPQSQSERALRAVPNRKPVDNAQGLEADSGSDYFPRQYAQLTQQMIRRCEAIINTLEESLSHMDASTTGRDGSPGVWHRDQLVMKMSNVIIMHHRLLDTWSKIAPLPHLASLPSTAANASRLAAIQSDIRRNFASYENLSGFDIDSTVAHIVNDLVVIGEKSAATASAPIADRQSLAYLFGAIGVLLLLQDGVGIKTVFAGAVIVGLWRCAQA